MKNTFITLTVLHLFATSIPVASQVIENVSFDMYTSPTDNDFVNNFSGGLGMSQVTTGGITGGCLTVPQTVNWGNDNAIYCSKYLNAPQNGTITSVSFRYDTTQVNGMNYDRAVSIFLRPSVDFNHYVIASVTYDQKIQIVSYSWANNLPPINLQHHHWYEFILTTEVLSASPMWLISVNAQVNDLGTTGQTPPIPVGSSSGNFSDSVLTVDPAIEVSFTASQWGGTQYIDNFRFQGVKSADSCTATSIQPIPFEKPEVILDGTQIILKNCKPGMDIELINSEGRVVYSGKTTGDIYTIMAHQFNRGIYILRTRSGRVENIMKIPLFY